MTLVALIALWYRTRIQSIRTLQKIETTKSFHDRLAGKLSAIAKISAEGVVGDIHSKPSEDKLTNVSHMARSALLTLRQTISLNDPGSNEYNHMISQISPSRVQKCCSVCTTATTLSHQIDCKL